MKGFIVVIRGLVITVTCLDPVATKTVFDSKVNITLIPLGVQRRVGSLPRILERLLETKRTPEAKFVSRLLSRLYLLQKLHFLYKHMVKYFNLLIKVLTATPSLSKVFILRIETY